MSIQTHLPPFWISRLCGLLLIPMCGAVVEVFDAWARAEGGTADWNPMNTTEPMPGATLYNSAGVKNYPNPVTGISATGVTLALSPYRNLWVALQRAKTSGQTASQIISENASAFDTWGTGAKNVLALLQ